MIHSSNSTETNCQAVKGWARVQCEHLAVYWKPLRCKKCGGCFLWKTKRVIAQVLTGLEGEEWKTFMTLTTRPSASWDQVMKWFSALMRWMRKSHSRVEYAAIKQEGGSTGMKHLHCLIIGPPWVPYVALSRKWSALSGAWSVDVRRVGSSAVAGYVARYVALGMLGARKAVTFSAGWRKSIKPKVLEFWGCGGGPEDRAWVVVLPNGTKVESWGPKGECVCPGCR